MRSGDRSEGVGGLGAVVVGAAYVGSVGDCEVWWYWKFDVCYSGEAGFSVVEGAATACCVSCDASVVSAAFKLADVSSYGFL